MISLILNTAFYASILYYIFAHDTNDIIIIIALLNLILMFAKLVFNQWLLSNLKQNHFNLFIKDNKIALCTYGTNNCIFLKLYSKNYIVISNVFLTLLFVIILMKFEFNSFNVISLITILFAIIVNLTIIKINSIITDWKISPKNLIKTKFTNIT